LLARGSYAALPRVPDGFKIRLVAAVPAVQYPSQVATAPDGSLFVGEDPMDQVGPADKPIDRILLFRDGKPQVVFAERLNAIFGMVWYDGALYVRLALRRNRLCRGCLARGIPGESLLGRVG
jgi:hypothetical protein